MSIQIYDYSWREALTDMLTTSATPFSIGHGDPAVDLPKAPWRRAFLPAFECPDGNIVSVQASKGHYCLPRTNHAPWSHVEVRFMRMLDAPGPAWAEYADTWDGEDRSTCVQYGWVPVALVYEYLEQHHTYPRYLVGAWRSARRNIKTISRQWFDYLLNRTK